jgi:hypothetical protein
MNFESTSANDYQFSRRFEELKPNPDTTRDDNNQHHPSEVSGVTHQLRRTKPQPDPTWNPDAAKENAMTPRNNTFNAGWFIEAGRRAQAQQDEDPAQTAREELNLKGPSIPQTPIPTKTTELPTCPSCGATALRFKATVCHRCRTALKPWQEQPQPVTARVEGATIKQDAPLLEDAGPVTARVGARGTPG